MNVADGYVPMNLWSKDHWSTFAYVESVMVDCAGFQVGLDPRMKSNRRNFRVMHQQCPKPKRTRSTGHATFAIVMSPENATKLRDGSLVENHDDWACLQDMAEAGLFTVGPDDVEPNVTLHLSARGQQIAAQLRQHKAAGGTFANFNASPELCAGASA